MDSKFSLFACLAVVFLCLNDPADAAPALLSTKGFLHNMQPKGEGSVLTCDLCKTIADILQDMFAQNKTEDEVADVATKICIDFHIQDRNVCTLVIPEFKGEVLTVVDMVGLSPRELCGAIVGPSCAKDYDPFNQPWNVTIPGNKPPVKPVNPPKPGSPVTRILHLSDMHWDPHYTPGLTNDCGEPLCCRIPNPKGNSTTAAGYWGDYNCDVPYHSLENLMQFVAGMSDQFDWVYWTGDLPAHNVWNQSRADQLYILDKLVAMMKQYLPDKIVFSTLGNHESAPVNSFPPPYITGYQSNQWLLNAAAEQWKGWLSQLPDWEETEKTIKWGGFYNVKVRDGLRVISLQTNYANGDNYWLYVNATDPAGQLAWLIKQLQAAEDSGDKVHIIGHILPSSFTKYFKTSYHRIVNRYESTIIGQFFGHTHQDFFEVFYDEQNKTRPTNVAYVGPAVTSYKGLNYGFRIYTMDGNYEGTSNAVVDHECYYLNITDANLTNKPKWLFEYSAKAAYGLKALQPANWDKLINTFASDDELFQHFYEYKSKMHATHPCDAACKVGELCSLKISFQPCNDLPEGVTMEDVEQYLLKQQMC